MKNSIRLILITFLVVLIAASAVNSQGHRRGRNGVREKMQLLKMWKMIEYLDLDEETGIKLFNIIKQYDNKHHELMMESRKLMGELKQELKKDKKNETNIKSLIRRIRANSDASHRARQEKFDAASKMLTLEQQAKLLIFEIEFMREVARLTHRAMGRGGKGPGRNNMNDENRNRPPQPQIP